MFDDGAGGRAAVVAFDLHVATRPVLEGIAHRVAVSTGIGIESLFGTAIHTHCGPGNFYGDDFYDVVASKTRGFRPATVDRIVDAVSCAIEDVCQALDEGRVAPVRLGYGCVCHFGTLWNRSTTAFLANFGVTDGGPLSAEKRLEVLAWCEQLNGAAPPPETWDDTRHDLGGYGIGKATVDARVRVLWIETLDGEPVAGLAFVSGTPTFVAGGAQTLTGDIPTATTSLVRSHLLTITGKDVPFALAGSAFGDVGMADERPLSRFIRERHDGADGFDLLTAEIGAAMGEAGGLARAVAAAWELARTDAATDDRLHGGRLRAHMGESEIAHPGNVPGHGHVLAEAHQVGLPAFAAAEVDHNWLLGAFGAVEGRKDPSNPSRGQAPKLDASGHPLGILTRMIVPAGAPAPFASIRVLRLGRVTLVGLPGEPTTFLAQRIAAGLGDDAGDPVIVAGLSGDYIGYFVTDAEYGEQQYEGASCLWGRHAGEWIVDEVAAVAAGERGVRFSRAPFNSSENPAIDTSFYVPRGTISPEWPDEPLHQMSPPRIVGRRILLTGVWSAPLEGRYSPLRGPWVGFSVRRADSASWEPLRVGRTPVTDATWPVLVRREQCGDEDFVRFRVAAYVPYDETLRGACFALDVTAEGPAMPVRWSRPESEPLRA